MEKLKELVIKLAIADQNKPLLPSQIAKIHQQLHSDFHVDLHTPTHPPYPAMIYKAIKELNEEGGSTEESISEYIKAKYKDLPFPHKTFLSQHLRQLRDKGFVVLTAGNCYMIHNLALVTVGRKPWLKRRYGVNHFTTPSQEYRVTEHNCLENLNSKRNKARRELVLDVKDEDELCNAITNKLNLTVLRSKDESSMKWPEQKSEEQQMRINKVIDITERKHLSCLQALVQTRFFDECKLHSDDGNSKCNWYCFDCMHGPLCNSCRIYHTDHTLVRIKRTTWEDVVTTSQILMCIDISGIETHLIAGTISVSLKRTVPSKRRKNFTGACFICKRYLSGSFKFCSLKCKFEHDLASYVPSSTN